MTSLIPIPQLPITVRLATIGDLPFVDSLQKLHHKNVGFLQMKALEGKVRAEQLFVAWTTSPCLDDQDTGRLPVLRAACSLSSSSLRLL